MSEQRPDIHAALCFVGPIQHPFTQNLRNVLCQYANEGVTHLTLLMSSYGGSLTEGFAIYNLMRSLPYTIHAHNIGTVESIANVMYLGAEHRTCAPESSFMIHGFTWTFQQETLHEAEISEKANTLATSRAEYVRIFESRAGLSSDEFEKRGLFNKTNVILPDVARDLGIVHDVAHLALPPGTRILNVAV